MVINTCTPNQAEGLPGATIRTLVVDDSPFMLKMLAQAVEAAGSFELIGSATDGIKALQYVSSLSPDLVLMDFYMPGLNGIQVTRYIKRGEHPPVVIIVSSEDSSAAKAAAEQAGADAFISKGTNLRFRIIATLHELFGRGCARQMSTAEATL